MPEKKSKNKSQKSKPEQQLNSEETNQTELEAAHLITEPKLLTDGAIHYRDAWEEKPGANVPPPTPCSDFGFEYSFLPLPQELPGVDKLKVPLVREKGVKICIELLADYFGCKDYNFSLFQFWFLDILTDCLWKTQDEFQFPDELQKTVLEWVLYIFNVIRDPRINFSRKKLLQFFKEAIILAAEVTDEGCPQLPSPQKLFDFVAEAEESGSSDSSSSESSSLSINSSDRDVHSYVKFNLANQPNCYPLKSKMHQPDNNGLLSSESLSDSATLPTFASEESESKISEESAEIEFYKSDHNIPSRFLPLPEEESHSETTKEETDSNISKCTVSDRQESTVGELEQDKQDETKFLVESVSGEFTILTDSEYSTNIKRDSCQEMKPSLEEHSHSKLGARGSKALVGSRSRSKALLTQRRSKALLTSQSRSKSMLTQRRSKVSVVSPHRASRSTRSILNIVAVPEKLTEKEVMKRWKEYHVWEKRMEDMADPAVGWLPELKEASVIQKESDEVLSDSAEWVDMVEQQQDEIRNAEENKMLNFAAIWAIIDFVFEYFYDSFQFTLIKLAFQACPNVISQDVNKAWKVPKFPKGELKKPPVKKKKEKKEKKPKKDKSSKASKKSKSSKGSKKDKKPKKGKAAKKDKKGKSSKGSKKDSKKSKKEKPKPLTKEEKERLEKERREEEEREAERIKQEENRRCMFPLTDAATDDLFDSIFEKWVKVDLSTKEGKKGKDKKGKKNKKKK